MTTPPWEPPLAGTEAEHLLGSIERMRATFRWKTDGLDRVGLATTIGASELTLGKLLKHLALVEDHYSTTALDGSSIGLPWLEIHDGTDDFVWRTAGDDSPEDLYALYDGAVLRARARYAAAVADRGLDSPAEVGDDDGNRSSIRRMLHDVLEEYGRHTGHADLLREAVDGRTGEDPPRDFRPFE